MITNYKQYKKLLENNNTHDLLYHGSKIENLENIKKYGVLPDFGDIVKSTEMWQYYTNDEYYNEEDRIEGLVFLSSDIDTYKYSNYNDDDKTNTDNALIAVIENNDTIFRKLDDKMYDFEGNEVDDVDYLTLEMLPPFIENGDYFSLEAQEPIDIIYGERLKEMI